MVPAASLATHIGLFLTTLKSASLHGVHILLFLFCFSTSYLILLVVVWSVSECLGSAQELDA